MSLKNSVIENVAVCMRPSLNVNNQSNCALSANEGDVTIASLSLAFE